MAISSGISGALFFSPFFMLVVGLSPAQAVGAGLLTEVFGMGNGLRLYVRQKVVDYRTARGLLIAAVPAVVAGALIAHAMPGRTLKLVFGGGLIALSVLILAGPAIARRGTGSQTRPRQHEDSLLVAADGTEYRLPRCSRAPGILLAGFGGALTGVISAGLPELNTTQMILRCRTPARIAVATSVFTLAVTAVAGAAVHALAAEPAWHVVQWSIPGVLVGSWIGSRVAKYLPGPMLERVLGVLFLAVGGLVLVLELGA